REAFLCSSPEWSQSDLVRGSRVSFCQRWTLLTEETHRIQSVLPPGPALPLNLLYVAERKTESPKASSAKVQDRSVYREDWGEALSHKSVPVLCCVDLKSGSLSVLQGVPSDVSPGQAVWSMSGESVFFVGWYHEPYRLGLKFCTNRRSALFQLDLEGHCVRLSEENVSVLSPRLSPDGSALVFLQGKVFGPHAQCLKMQMLDLKSNKIFTLIDVVHRAQSGEFAGVYEALPSCCWSEDSQRVVFSSAHKNWKVQVLIQILVFFLLFPDESEGLREFGSWRLLTIHRDLMVVCCSSPNTPPTLVLHLTHTIEVTNTFKAGEYCSVLLYLLLEKKKKKYSYNVKFAGLDFGAILLKPSPQSETKLPLVVFIHGKFLLNTHCIVAVNYRGSTGFGQDSILSLIGQIGQQDVKDVQRAVQFALQTDSTLDPERLAVFGGSHGGFLSCHLIGQYPDVYRACAVRNPVVNAATLLGPATSSTGNHCLLSRRYSSVGLEFSYERIPTAEALAMKCALLLMLGGRDRRVSPHQGLELYRALKSRGRDVRLLWFPEDGHSLSRVDTQTDCFLNTVLWLQEHL
uniref:Acylamino-acid-releasing enzyme n=1 Tax=Neogobius melanostomus TaxID=47308 RepID=A0A8C6UAN4_9GOBI